MIRNMTTNVTFRHAFALKGLERPVPPGTYRVDVEEDAIDGLSFLAYRRLATFITVPVAGQGGAPCGRAQSAAVGPPGGAPSRRRRRQLGERQAPDQEDVGS